MDDLAQKTLLYDFYGEMLTNRQQEVFEDYYLNDLSLGEIAEELSISRAAVHDNLKRCEKVLNNFEDKLKLINRYIDNKKVIQQILDMTYEDKPDTLINIRELITDIIETL
jgi:predicted DNA-binding protein YlxM (UPF0122 family)